MFGTELEWLKKRIRAIEENLLWCRKWTEEIKQAENLFKVSKDYLEITEIINKSE